MPQTISVVIPTFNYGRFLRDAIKSVLAQTLSADEVIVVDDGSTDDTEAVVREVGLRVKYLHQENRGVCAARNRGVAESNGELVAFLDADDAWEPTKLALQSSRFDEDPEIGLVHCGMREFNSETGETLAMLVDGAEGDVADRLLLWETPAVNVSGSSIAVSRRAFEEVGGFDTQMKVGEDWDFCYRVARRYKVGFVPEPLVNYRSHGDAAHRNVEEMERGMARFYEKAFADPAVAHLRRRAYGNFHRVLAGSYFHAGRYGKFARHSIQSVLSRPANLSYFLAYPFRRSK